MYTVQDLLAVLLDIVHFFCQIQYFGIRQTQTIVATLEDIMFINLLYYMMLIQLKPLIIGLTMF